MEDFVLMTLKAKMTVNQKVKALWNYATLLKQPPELWMFVPCDEEGRVIQEPDHVYDFDTQDYKYLCEEYQQAKQRCLFEGFEVEDIKGKFSTVSNGNRMIYFQEGKEWKHKTLSEITHYNLKLSQTALNKIYK
jgi:hypothetical protein